MIKFILFSLFLIQAYGFMYSLNNRIMNKKFIIKSTTVEDAIEERVIKITPSAMDHLMSLKTKQNNGKELLLRMGVRAGGCSGMSYIMDVIDESQVTEDDHIETYQGIRCAVDPKSLLFLYGLQLDYSHELIGGGFKFSNPNAETSCGCGKSFGV
eukprot:gene911-1767_t